MLALLDLVQVLRTSHFFSVDEHSFPCHTTRFFGLIMGINKVCLCLICSQNKTLQFLYLDHNQIGDAGAASIGGALAYVTLLPCE
jgi:hypothetical protein